MISNSYCAFETEPAKSKTIYCKSDLPKHYFFCGEISSVTVKERYKCILPN